jgi:ribonuclease III
MGECSQNHPLEQILGHSFANHALLEQALTHRGALGTHRSLPISAVEGNERLEFLGDRVLGLVIADALLNSFAGENEGGLAPRLAALVSATTLAQVASSFGLPQYVKVARGQRVDTAETAVLADACEAVIGALYLDGGLLPAAKFINAHWGPLMHAELVPPKDKKTALQEWAQARSLALPTYSLLEESGPAHAPSFKMTVSVEGYAETTGQGRTKRLATQAAATAFLEKLSEKSV